MFVGRLEKRLKDKDMGIELTPAAKILLATRGYDPAMGARPLRRANQRSIENPLAKRILAGDYAAGSMVTVDVSPDGGLTFNGSAEPAPSPQVMSVPGGSGTVN
jgi:ATP-dependent Clp protease ATP-binding subunit ClpC